jgi:hypothetical protein
MVDLTQLTQEEVWGIQYARQSANKPIQARNAEIEARNANLPEGSTPEPLEELLTDQQYIDGIVRKCCQSYYSQLIAEKEQLALNMFRSLSPEEQAALVQQFQIPDIVQS